MSAPRFEYSGSDRRLRLLISDTESGATLAVPLTPRDLARAFSELPSARQAEVFEALADISGRWETLGRESQWIAVVDAVSPAARNILRGLICEAPR